MKKLLLSPSIHLILALILGVAFGFVPGSESIANPIADLFLKVLKLVSLPLLFFSLTSTISGMEGWDVMRTLGRKVLKYTLLTTFIAALVALGLYLIIQPAQNASSLLYMEVEQPLIEGNYLSLVFEMFPSNMIQAFSDNNVMGIVIIAFMLGFGALTLPSDQKDFMHRLFASLFQILMKITIAIVKFMPLGVFAFMVVFVQQFRSENQISDQIFWYFICVVLANLVQAFIVLPLILIWKGVSPKAQFKGMFPALALAFATRSSNASLPVTLECAENRLGIPKKITRFSLPLCSTINMNGCAAFILITVLFVSMIHGISFSVFSLILWVFLATIAAIGNAGVPMGCYFLSVAFLSSLGIPLQVMGFILPLYTLIDMLETAVNIWSDSCVTSCVHKDLS